MRNSVPLVPGQTCQHGFAVRLGKLASQEPRIGADGIHIVHGLPETGRCHGTRLNHPLRSTGFRFDGFHEGLNLLHQATDLAVLHFCREGKRHTAQGLPMEVKEEPAFLVLSGSSPTELGCDTDYISIPHISD
ncbi:MAG: hypothetical protein KHX53_13470 [Bacteroides sp.]|nr:hypothetical protein [Bacteroides sp.]